MTTAQKAAIIVLLILGLIGAAWVARGRIAVERSNRTVALCLDDLEVRELAAVTGQPAAALMQQFKNAGITHIAVSEQTLGQLLESGTVKAVGASPNANEVVLTAPKARFPRVAKAFGKFPGAGESSPPPPPAGTHALGPDTLTVPSIAMDMVSLGMGYDEDTIAAIKQAGLGFIARPMPDFLYTPEAVAASLKTVRDAGADIVLFNGVSVAGGTKLAKYTAEVMKKLGLKFGYVELVPQEGAPALASALKYQIIRTHSISQEEMTKTSPSRGLDRFTLGVTERNIRLCYIRLLLQPQADLLKANTDYITSISTSLRKSGYSFGDPEPLRRFSLGRSALALIALGLVGGVLWFLQLVFAMPRRCFWILLALGVVIALGGSFGAFNLVRSLVALLAAIIFPSLAVLYAAHAAAKRQGDAPVLAGLGLTLLAAGITVIGGLLIAGSLSSSDYMMQIAQFRGVKLAQLLPLVIVLAVTLGTTYAGADAKGWGGLRRGWIAAAEAFVKYWHAVAIFLALGVVGFMLMRSGNESAVEVSGLEMKLRALLDQILIVRPRTKEIMLGYPALMMGLSLLIMRRRRAAWIWLTVGTIAVISTTNTFCHLHTPLTVSLLRVVNGVWVGLLVGIVWWVAKSIGERILQRFWWNYDL